ncbi:Major facilitator superfamily domain, general substrate transporter [Cordyceps fumosorosea ARSEF 2679]|uniref:Major facilitator superfamily domain, general substrate transporter n=1 Tax=Cordyceps fumosorosea (strain ARSEF 2679) TaxID=1081104 RepID=A0A168E599_CORFA|nr:Major facilitator superfamily domain, general substrate transporter [Cordyceps fumosorosea ARSEF 2679]OAA73393.1 Major facilitator superfamily domain, general substrate transporter [Cordyceps fumosorosea ARSEF 2679]
MAQQQTTPLGDVLPLRHIAGTGSSILDQPQGKTSRAERVVDSSTPILHLYLDFDTPLPSPPWPPRQTPGTSIPRCPDLRAYTSPLEWSPARKSVLLVLSCLATFLTAYTAGAYSPPAGLMAADFGTSRTAVMAGITTFCAGFGFAPMALAPLSEAWGRYPIFVVAGCVYLVFQVLCSVMPHVAGMLVCRLFVGVGASVFSAVVGGVIADLWGKEDRNTPMALFSGSVLLGTGAGPLVSAALIDIIKDRTRAWQWTFWHQVIMDAVLVGFLIVFFKESRASVLLTRKAKILNAWYVKLEEAGVCGVWICLENVNVASSSEVWLSQSRDSYSDDADRPAEPQTQSLQLRRVRWVVKADELRPTLKDLVTTSIERPFALLFTEPVVFCFSLWAAFSWGVLYLSFSVVPFLYNGDLDMSSRVYISMMAATAVATITGVFQEQLLKHPSWKSIEAGGRPTDSRFWRLMRRKFPAEAPESRLYFACITAMLLPAGLFIGFLCPNDWKAYAQAIGLGFALWGIYSVYLATFNYLADTYHVYASSALASQSLCRNLLGGAFPLIATPLFRNLGTRAAGGMLGGIGTALTVIPWVLVFFGQRIRARSKIAISLQK